MDRLRVIFHASVDITEARNAAAHRRYAMPMLNSLGKRLDKQRRRDLPKSSVRQAIS